MVLKLLIGLLTSLALTVIIFTLGGNVLIACGASLVLGVGWESIWNRFFVHKEL